MIVYSCKYHAKGGRKRYERFFTAADFSAAYDYIQLLHVSGKLSVSRYKKLIIESISEAHYDKI